MSDYSLDLAKRADIYKDAILSPEFALRLTKKGLISIKEKGLVKLTERLVKSTESAEKATQFF